MAKLSELIRRSSRREPVPIGFHPAARQAERPSLLLLATFGDGEERGIEAAVSAGAQSVLLSPNSGGVDEGRLRTLGSAAGEAALGLWLRGAGRAQAAAAREAGVNYLVLGDEATPAEVLLDEQLEFVLSLPEGMEDSLLRTVETLPLEAILVGYWEGELTVRRLLELRRLSGFTRAPLLIGVQSDIPAGQLETLREAGVVGVIVDGEATEAAAIASLAERIAKLPPRRRRRREEQIEPLLPAAGAAREHEEDEEEDE